MARSQRELQKLMTSRNVKRQRRRRMRFFALMFCVILCIGIAVGGVNLYITRSTAGRILTAQQAAQREFDITLNTDDVGTDAAFRRVVESVVREHEREDEPDEGGEPGDAPVLLIIAPRHQLYRALYLARQLGLEAYGAPGENTLPRSSLPREMLARIRTAAEGVFI